MVTANKTDMDPTKPRRARSAYNFFFKSRRAEIQAVIVAKTGKKGTYSQVSKAVAHVWKKVLDEDKVYYHNLAAQDKLRYGLELVQWQLKKEASQELEESFKETETSDFNQEAPFSKDYMTELKGSSQEVTPQSWHNNESPAPFHLPAYNVRPMEHMTESPDALMLSWTEQDSEFLKRALGML